MGLGREAGCFGDEAPFRGLDHVAADDPALGIDMSKAVLRAGNAVTGGGEAVSYTHLTLPTTPY